jgi:hypothetical protein
LKKDIKDLDVKLSISESMLELLSRAVAKPKKEVLYDLLDMSTKVRNRLTKRNGNWCEDYKVPFPQLKGVKFTIRAERDIDSEKYSADYEKWSKKQLEEVGAAPAGYDEYQLWVVAFEAWRKANPLPQSNHYPIVSVSFTIENSDVTSYSTNDLEIMMMEQFLLGFTEDEPEKGNDKDVGQQ